MINLYHGSFVKAQWECKIPRVGTRISQEDTKNAGLKKTKPTIHWWLMSE